MLNINEIITLAGAGFNATQIAMLNNMTQTMTQQMTQPMAQPAPHTTGSDNIWDSMMSKMDAMANMIQSNNVLNSNQPPQQSVDDVLAEIINPKE